VTPNIKDSKPQVAYFAAGLEAGLTLKRTVKRSELLLALETLDLGKELSMQSRTGLLLKRAVRPEENSLLHCRIWLHLPE